MPVAPSFAVTSSPPPSCNWCPVWTSADLRAAQDSDLDIGKIAGWHEAFLDRPKRSDPCLLGASRTLLRLWSQWSRLKLVDGVLYRTFFHEDGHPSDLQLVVPRALRFDVMKAAHNDVSGGHLGIQRTLAKAKTRFYWPFMTTDIEVHCSSCLDCAARKTPIPKHQAPMALDRPSCPLQRVAIDLLGPLPTTRTGNKYIAVICDYFTKWVEAFPLPDIRAVTVASAFVDGFVCRYGVPVTLHSDQGSQFTSHLFMNICNLLGLHKPAPHHIGLKAMA